MISSKFETPPDAIILIFVSSSRFLSFLKLTIFFALSIIKKIQFTDAADQIKKAINSGKAKEFFYNAR